MGQEPAVKESDKLEEMGSKRFADEGTDQNEIEIAVDKESLLAECLSYMEAEADAFSNPEILRLLFLLKQSPHYRYLLKRLPLPWQPLVEDVLSGRRQRDFAND